MGADLYIMELFTPNNEKYNSPFHEACRRRDLASSKKEKAQWQDEANRYFDLMYSKGYFRDCYNDFALFNFIRCNTSYEHLSWWRLRDTPGWFDETGNQNLNGVKEFLEIIETARGEITGRNEFALRVHAPNPDTRKIRNLSPEEATFYRQWLGELDGFLSTSLESGYRVHWSV